MIFGNTVGITIGDEVGSHGEQAVCLKCAGGHFMIWQGDGEDHPHIQCCSCGSVYCQALPHVPCARRDGFVIQ